MTFSLKEIHTLLLGNVMALGFVDGIKNTCKTVGLNEDAGIESWIIGLAIGILVMAYVLPMAFTAFYSQSVATFCKTTVGADGNLSIQRDSTVISLWYLIPVLIVVGVIIYFAIHKHEG